LTPKVEEKRSKRPPPAEKRKRADRDMKLNHHEFTDASTRHRKRRENSRYEGDWS